MALVVESTANNSSTSNALTITKPASLVAGDLMVASLQFYSNTSSDNVATLSGWTSAVNQESPGAEISVQYKVADSGDVAASNFTFSASGTDGVLFGGSIMRVSESAGFDAADGDVLSNVGTTTPSFPTTVSPAVNGSLVIIAVIGFGNRDTGSFTGFSVSGDTLSFTELHDYTVDSGTGDEIMASAYSIQSTATAFTAYNAVVSPSKDYFVGAIAVFSPVVNATGANTFFVTTTEPFAQAGTADGVMGSVLTETDTTMFAQNGKGTAPTQLTNEAKPSTTWVNETK